MIGNNSIKYDFMFKILLIGDSSVGKTCFLLRYIEDSFTDNFTATIGVDHRAKIIKTKNKELVKIQIWDTAGQDKFRCITKNILRWSNGILLIYDTTSNNYYNNIKSWISQINESLGDEPCLVLVGNKVDLENQRQIIKNEGEKLAKEYNMILFETSAKENIKIKEVFEYLVEEMVKKYKANKFDSKEKNNSKTKKIKKESIMNNNKKKWNWCWWI